PFSICHCSIFDPDLSLKYRGSINGKWKITNGKWKMGSFGLLPTAFPAIQKSQYRFSPWSRLLRLPLGSRDSYPSTALLNFVRAADCDSSPRVFHAALESRAERVRPNRRTEAIPSV